MRVQTRNFALRIVLVEFFKDIYGNLTYVRASKHGIFFYDMFLSIFFFNHFYDCLKYSVHLITEFCSMNYFCQVL